MMEKALACSLSLEILTAEVNTKAMQLMMLEYRRALRSLRMAMSNTMKRRASHHEGDTVDNPRYLPGAR